MRSPSTGSRGAVRPRRRLRLNDRLLIAIAVLGFLLVVLAVHSGPTPSAAPRSPTSAASAASPAPRAPVPGSGRELVARPTSHHHHFGLGFLREVLWFLLKLVVTMVALLLVAGGLSRLLNLKRSTKPDPPRPPVEEPALDDLAGPVSRIIDDTLYGVHRREADSAIVSCWVRLEELAVRVGIAPAASGTSTELVSRLISSASASALLVSEEPLQRLAALYREARFSRHRMSPEMTEQARLSLEQLRQELLATPTRRADDD